MKRTLGIILSSGLVFALLGFLLGHLVPPVWEGRAVVWLEEPQALAAVPDALPEWASGCAIPGTDVLELACRSDSPEGALAALEGALEAMDTLLLQLQQTGRWEVLTTVTKSVSLPDPWKYALTAALLGAAAAALWLLPPASHREPLSLAAVLGSMARLARKYAPAIGLTAALFAGLGLLTDRTPQSRCTALIRIGSYDPATAEGLANAALGLLRSPLCALDLTAEAVGKTNLLRLTAGSESVTAALPEVWETLRVHIPGSPELTLLETGSVTVTPALSPALAGLGLGIFLWAVILFALAIPREPKVCAGD